MVNFEFIIYFRSGNDSDYTIPRIEATNEQLSWFGKIEDRRIKLIIITLLYYFQPVLSILEKYLAAC